MLKRVKKGIEFYEFHHLEGFSGEVGHAVVTRKGGVSVRAFKGLNMSFDVGDKASSVNENRKRLMEVLGLKNLVEMKQVHGKKVGVFLGWEQWGEKADSEVIFGIDALVTNIKGVGLMVMMADCQAAVIYDPVLAVVGVVHAGWKGLKQNIYAETVGVMQERFGCNPANLMVGISPSLGPENAEFTEPAVELGIEYREFFEGRKVDLWGIAKKQLIRTGVLEEKIEFARVCTAQKDQAGKYFSYRRDEGKTGRNCLIAWIK